MRKVKQQDKAHGDVGFNKRILRKQPEKRSKACSNCTCFEASTEAPVVTRRYSAFLHTAVDAYDARCVFGQFEVHPVTARFAMERQNKGSQLKLASMHDIQGDAKYDLRKSHATSATLFGGAKIFSYPLQEGTCYKIKPCDFFDGMCPPFADPAAKT
jgi:hypothetical protein